SFQNLVHERRAALEVGQHDVDGEQRDDQDRRIGQGEVIPQQRLLGRFRDDQQEDKIERRELTKRAPSGQPQNDEQKEVDRYTPEDCFHDSLTALRGLPALQRTRRSSADDASSMTSSSA